MAKDLEKCAAAPEAVLREFRDGHLKVQQAVVMALPARALANSAGPWRVSEPHLARASDFHKAQILTGLRKMVVSFDQVRGGGGGCRDLRG